MKTFLKVLVALALGYGALAAAPAMAHGRVGFGFYFGGPVWYPAPYYYPPPAYYYPAPVVVQSAPTYVERPAESSAPPSASNDWYYCRDSQAYYPYVKQCASPWERVPAKP